MNIEEFKLQLEKVRVWYDTLTDFDLYKPWLLYKKDELFIALAYIVSEEQKEKLKSIPGNSQVEERYNCIEQKLYNKFITFRRTCILEYGVQADKLDWVNLILYKHKILRLIDFRSGINKKYFPNEIPYEFNNLIANGVNGYIQGTENYHMYIEHTYDETEIGMNLKAIKIQNGLMLLGRTGATEYWPPSIACIKMYIAQFKEYQHNNLMTQVGYLAKEEYHTLLHTLTDSAKDLIKIICMLHYTDTLNPIYQDAIPILYKTLECFVDKNTLDKAFEQYQLTKSIKHLELILTGEIDNLAPVHNEPITFDLI